MDAASRGRETQIFRGNLQCIREAADPPALKQKKAAQLSLHDAPIFRLLLKIAVF